MIPIISLVVQASPAVNGVRAWTSTEGDRGGNDQPGIQGQLVAQGQRVAGYGFVHVPTGTLVQLIVSTIDKYPIRVGS